MLPFKLLVLLLFQVLTGLALDGSALINLPQLDEEQINWPQQKLQTTEYLLKTLTEYGNVTLVGWQQILNNNGTLKEIKTIELTILTPLSSAKILKTKDIDLLSAVLGLLQFQEKIVFSTGVSVGGSIGQWTRDGSILNILDVHDPGTIKVYYPEYGEILFWQQNMTVTSHVPIQNLIKFLQQQSTVQPVGVLTYNIDGTLNIQQSTIVPEYLGVVLKAENATLNMAELALTGLAEGYLLHRKEISKYVANYMKQTVPGYIWVTGQNMDSLSINSGVHLRVEYLWIEMEEVLNKLDVIGIKI